MIKFGKNHKKKKNLQGKQSKILSIQQNLPFFVKGVDDLNYKVDLCPYYKFNYQYYGERFSEKDFCLGESLGLYDGHFKICPYCSNHHVCIRRIV